MVSRFPAGKLVVAALLSLSFACHGRDSHEDGPSKDSGSFLSPAHDAGGQGDTGAADGPTYGPRGDCSEGQTQCPSGCVDEANDVANCGSCGYACPSGPAGTSASCVAGTCTYACSDPTLTYCTDGTSLTPTSGTCVDLQTSTESCGACGQACIAGGGAEPSCQEGVCQSACPNGGQMCGGQCEDVQSDPNNCGGCGVNCASAAMAKGFSNPDQAVCVAGACQLTTTVQVLSLNCVNSTCTTSCTSACQSTFGLSCNDTVHCDNGTVAGGSCADYDYFNADNQLTPCDAVANDGWVQGFACDTVPPSTNGCEIAGTYSQGAVLTEVDCMCTGTATF